MNTLLPSIETVAADEGAVRERSITLPLGGSAKPGRERSLQFFSGNRHGTAPYPATRSSRLTLPKGGCWYGEATKFRDESLAEGCCFAFCYVASAVASGLPLNEFQLTGLKGSATT